MFEPKAALGAPKEVVYLILGSLQFSEAALRVYNQYGRRDNIFKARVKILVHSLGIDKMRAEVEAEFAAMTKDKLELPETAVAAIRAQFSPPP